MASEIINVLLSDIYYDDVFNCRGEFTRQSVYDLAQSIAATSLLCPIILRANHDTESDTQPYHLVAGHRRFKAIEWWLKWDKIPALIHLDLDDEAARIVNLTENIEREDLTYVEQGLAIKETFPDMSLRGIGDRLHRSTYWIKQRFDLIQLSSKLQDYVTNGKLTLRDVELLLRLTPSERETEVEVLLARKQRGESTSISVRRSRLRKASEIKQMMARMIEGGASGLAPKTLAWALGNYSDDEFETIWQDWVAQEGWRNTHEDDPTDYIVDSRITFPNDSCDDNKSSGSCKSPNG